MLNDQPKQSVSLLLADGSTVLLELEYIANQQGWFYSVTHAAIGFAALGRRVVSSPNMLSALRRFAPFGLNCLISDSGEAWLQSDFSSARVKLYLIEKDELDIVNEISIAEPANA